MRRNWIHIATRQPVNEPGGLNTFALGLATGQRKVGDSATVLSGPSLRRARKLFAAASSRPATDSVVEFHFAQTALPLALATRRLHLPTVFHFHGPWAGESRMAGEGALRVHAKRIYESLTYSRIEQFTTASAAFRELLIQEFGVAADKVSVLQPGVDIDRFHPHSKEAARRRLELPVDARLAVCIRRLERRMGIDVALKALHRIPDVHLAIAGQGPELASLTRLTAELGLRDRVHFLGRVEDHLLASCFQAADVTLVPSVGLEGFGLVVLESFACGTPVVSSSVGGLSDAMGPFAQDWTFSPHDHKHFIELWKAALLHPPSPVALREHAQSMSWEAAAQRLRAMMEFA